jgi:hypothetical protein
MCSLYLRRDSTWRNLERARQETKSLCMETLSLHVRPQEVYGITLGDRWWSSNTVVPWPEAPSR